MSYLDMSKAIKFPEIDRDGLSTTDKVGNAIRRMFTPNDGLSWVTRKQHNKCFRFRIVSLAMGL